MKLFFYPNFISLGPGVAGSDGISGKLVLVCGSHYPLKSGSSPRPSKVVGFTLGFGVGQGEGTAVLVLPPTGCRCEITPVRMCSGHLGALEPGEGA